MAPETMAMPAVDRLAVEQRNALQAELINPILGEEASEDEKLTWLLEHGKKISELIDYHEHDEIRNLALEENYEAAARLLSELLEEE